MPKTKQFTDEDLFSLRPSKLWGYFKSESFAFWMICAYLFFEYVRPQSIVPEIDILPWTKLTIIGALIGCFFDKSVKWVSSSINFFLVLFLFVIFLSSVLAYFPSVSYKYLDSFYLWVVIYFLVINIVNTRRRFFLFITIFILCSFKISFSLSITWAKRGFSFTDWGLMGPPGFFQNSGELAIQMLVFWPIAWAFAHSIKSYLIKWQYRALTLVPITGIMVILGSSSRGGQLALVVQLIMMNYRRIFKPRVLISVGITLALIWSFLPDEQKERFQAMGEDRTSRQRILYWENGIEMISENPLLGVGYFNFIPYYEMHYADDILFRRAELPHNILIQVGTDAGLLGLSVFLLLIALAYRKASKFKDEVCVASALSIGTCANVSLMGFVVAGQFVTVAYYPYLWIHLALLVCMINSFSQRISVGSAKSGRSKR